MLRRAQPLKNIWNYDLVVSTFNINFLYIIIKHSNYRKQRCIKMKSDVEDIAFPETIRPRNETSKKKKLIAFIKK